ncbi:MAG: T9SS type A sorting domain-containing protein [Bacteroidota bacterium]
MKKLLLLSVLLLCFTLVGRSLFAQTFTPKTSGVKAFYNSMTQFADVDGDGDEDLFIAGFTSTLSGDIHATLLYLNDGQGNFDEAPNTPFVGVCCIGDMSVFDADADGDFDIAIIGTAAPFTKSTRLYLNDGNGIFSDVAEQPFRQGILGQITPADVDNDGDMDVLLAGSDFGAEPPNFIILYMNDGAGNFTPKEDIPFSDLSQTSGTFADIDNDGDLDYLLSGGRFAEDPLESKYSTILYKNDGAGNFTEVENTPFRGVLRGTLEFQDFDGDDDLDVLVMGDTSRVSLPVPIAEMYLNDGDGNFELFEDLKLATPIAFSGVDFADVDGDNDLDILATGDSLMDNYTTILYLNEGLGNYEPISTPFSPIGYGSADLVDVDGDGDLDVFLTGQDVPTRPTVRTSRVTELYLNDRIMTSSQRVVDFSSRLTIAPNPVADVLMLEVSEFSTGSILEITDTQGRLLSSQLLRNKQIQIDVSDLAKGIYYLKVGNAGSISIQQFVKI